MYVVNQKNYAIVKYRNYSCSRTLRFTRSSIRNGYFPVLFDSVLRYNDTGNSSYKNGIKKKREIVLTLKN